MWSNVDNASWQILKKVLSVNVVACSLTSFGTCFRHVNVTSRNHWYPLSILMYQLSHFNNDMIEL